MPAGREKPWGTGHAVWCARQAIAENFAVINADDFYGQDSFRQLAQFLMRPHASATSTKDAVGSKTAAAGALEFAIVGFRLGHTLSEHGAVSRGICTQTPDGRLATVTEQVGILPEAVGAGRKFTGEEIVSMNCWGFTPGLFAALDEQLRAFLVARGSEPKSEFYLPAAVTEMINRGEASVCVLPTEASWFGVTYRDDKPRVAAALAELVKQGLYPAKLF
jgi:hypothetical protein